MSVLEVNLKEILSYRGCPIVVTNHKNLHILRNRFTKDIVAAGVKEPEPPSLPACVPKASREILFISDDMESVPYHQLIPNCDLRPHDMSSIGLQCIRKFFSL